VCDMHQAANGKVTDAGEFDVVGGHKQFSGLRGGQGPTSLADYVMAGDYAGWGG
jgi:hypothetical protein